MLLDRRRIKKWAKWIALILAIVFAASFLFLGVGYGGAGFDLSQLFRGGCSAETDTTEPQTGEEKLNTLLAAYEANPQDTTNMLAIATAYEDLYEAGEGEGTEYLNYASAFLRNAIDVDPTLKDVYLRVADIYLTGIASTEAYTAAAEVLNKATTVDPQNPQIYLKLGIAHQNLNNRQAAVLAWQKYLELDPNGEMADVVREQIKVLTETTTTTAASTTTTTAP
ncbi:MAG: tetratricopeptide repeat protein [Thermoleophilia bacterium]|nr:tetratricopeptide repeat protein [Thermoleophilia bacterium]